MRNKVIEVYNAVCGVVDKGESHIYASGLCFLGRKEPELHPVQGELEREMWEVLTAEDEEYNAWYDLGVAGMPCIYSEEYAVSENELLYLRDRPHNWNEGLDREMTKDMNLIYAFHNLYEHCYFSIFDFLWVREFYSEFDVIVKTADGVDWDAMQNLFE